VSETRIARRFAALRAEGRAGLVAFVSAGDPDAATFERILSGLPAAGADLIEIGIPFTDPAADGPAIQASGQRALRAGMSLRKALDCVRRFREGDDATPIVLMGYYNPILRLGPDAFAAAAAAAGVDGIITVDLPPEEEAELRDPVQRAGIDIVRLIAPTTDDARLGPVLADASGFVYYVSIAGITGTRSPTLASVEAAAARLRRTTELPVAIGFGIKTAEQAAEVARVADAVVVGSAIVQTIADHLDDSGRARDGLVEAVLGFVGELAAGVRGARARR
jgi:tryptophan synthase alpha chain